MAQIEGKYEMESSENFAEFMKELDIPFDQSKIDRSKKSTMEITCNGDEYQIKSETSGIARETKFKLGEEFEEEMYGLKYKCVVQKEGDSKLVDVMTHGDKTVKIEREFCADGAVFKATCNNVTWTRKYKRV